MSIEPEIFWKTKQNETLKKNSLTLNTPERGEMFSVVDFYAQNRWHKIKTKITITTIIIVLFTLLLIWLLQSRCLLES